MTTNTNQFFSPSRFGNYAASALMLRSRQLLLTAIAVPSGRMDFNVDVNIGFVGHFIYRLFFPGLAI
jgi:hypothetical protein